MKKFLLIMFFVQTCAFAQFEKEINKHLNIEEILSDKEIRIYRKAEITNFASFFRLYQNKNRIWEAEFYDFFFAWEENDGDDVQKVKIIAKKESSYIWQEILTCDVLHLPEQEKFRYKLKDKPRIESDKGEYGIAFRQKVVLDGESYKVIIKDGSKQNSFEYDNPRSYLKLYPDVDELNSFVQLLKKLENEFGIWTD